MLLTGKYKYPFYTLLNIFRNFVIYKQALCLIQFGHIVNHNSCFNERMQYNCIFYVPHN